MVDHITCEYGETCKLPSNQYSKTGYTFTGWTLGESGEIFNNEENIWPKMESKITKDGLSFYVTATFRLNQCSISYNKGSGNFGTNQNYIQTCYYGQNCTPLAASYFSASLDWYHFKEWSNGVTNLAQSATYEVSTVCPNISNGDTSVTLIAQWKENKFTVHYDMNGGTLKAGRAQSCPDSVGNDCKGVCTIYKSNDKHCTGSKTGEVKTWSKKYSSEISDGGLANFMDYDDGQLYAKKSGKSATKYYHIGSTNGTKIDEKKEWKDGKDLVCNGFGKSYCDAFKTGDIDV